jgi:hypothetical protein
VRRVRLPPTPTPAQLSRTRASRPPRMPRFTIYCFATSIFTTTPVHNPQNGPHLVLALRQLPEQVGQPQQRAALAAAAPAALTGCSAGCLLRGDGGRPGGGGAPEQRAHRPAHAHHRHHQALGHLRGGVGFITWGEAFAMNGGQVDQELDHVTKPQNGGTALIGCINNYWNNGIPTSGLSQASSRPSRHRCSSPSAPSPSAPPTSSAREGSSGIQASGYSGLQGTQG